MIENVEKNIFYIIWISLLGDIPLTTRHNRNGCNILSGEVLNRST